MFTVICNNIQLLRGQGIEILTDSQGNFLAKFYDGMFVASVPKGNDEVTNILLENVQ